MGAGLHGENGLDPESALVLFRTYILPILTYGLEIVLPFGNKLESIQMQYKRWIKQILSLNINTADPAIFILSGLLPLEAEIHIKAFTLFGSITRADKDSVEWQLAERQLQIKNYSSNSWFIEIKKLSVKYGFNDIYQYLHNPLSKNKWKSIVLKKIHTYWKNNILETT